MSTTGPRDSATVANDAAVGTIAWTNPTNALLADDSRATSVLIATQVTNYLKATNCGFLIPLDATIDGILVEIEKSATVSVALADSNVKIVKADGTFGSANKAAGGNWPTTDAYSSYGSATDLWSETWTPGNINDVDFGVGISASCAVGATAQVDHVRITVYWTGSNRSGSLEKRFRSGGGMSLTDERGF